MWVQDKKLPDQLFIQNDGRVNLELALQPQKADLKIINFAKKKLKVFRYRYFYEFIVRFWWSRLCSRLSSHEEMHNPKGVSQTVAVATNNSSVVENWTQKTSKTSDVLGRMTNVPPR